MPNFQPVPERTDYVMPEFPSGSKEPIFLREHYNAILRDVEGAMRKLCNGDAPLSRNYRPQGQGAFAKVQLQESSMIQRLSSVRDELAKLVLHCNAFVPQEESLPLSKLFDLENP